MVNFKQFWRYMTTDPSKKNNKERSKAKDIKQKISTKTRKLTTPLILFILINSILSRYWKQNKPWRLPVDLERYKACNQHPVSQRQKHRVSCCQLDSPQEHKGRRSLWAGILSCNRHYSDHWCETFWPTTHRQENFYCQAFWDR